MAFADINTTAKKLGTSPHALRLAAKSGTLPGARKVGGRWFIHIPTLERYFESALPAQRNA